jgi:hypothetical protein
VETGDGGGLNVGLERGGGSVTLGRLPLLASGREAIQSTRESVNDRAYEKRHPSLERRAREREKRSAPLVSLSDASLGLGGQASLSDGLDLHLDISSGRSSREGGSESGLDGCESSVESRAQTADSGQRWSTAGWAPLQSRNQKGEMKERINSLPSLIPLPRQPSQNPHRGILLVQGVGELETELIAGATEFEAFQHGGVPFRLERVQQRGD